jgi:hypothetical protein
MTRWLLSVFLVLMYLPAACSSSGSQSDTEDLTGQIPEDAAFIKEELPIVVKMDPSSEADFLTQVESDPELQQMWSKLQAAGHTKFTHSGRLEQDDGVVVLWGETEGGATGLLRHCTGDTDCVRAIWTMNGGQAEWKGADGSNIEARSVGLPILLKELEGHSYDKPTHVVDLALEPPAQMPEIDVTTRRFYVISAFGPLWANGSLDTANLRSLADKTGAFDEVVGYSYVRQEVVDDVLMKTHPYDVLIWVGQTIREEFKTNEIFKPVGMTTNAGIFGDVIYNQGRMEEILSFNPLQGPGLMVLAGCETMGDGNTGGEKDKSIPVTLDNKVRTLVGFKRCGDARDIMQATELFLTAFLSGDSTLEEALATANSYLASESSELTMETLPEANLERKFLPDLDSYWAQYSDDPPPGDSIFNSNINIVNMCTDSSGQTYQANEHFATAWSTETSFNGPFFQGTRVNPDNLVDFEFEGTLGDIVEGAHFFFVVRGSLSPKVQGITMYGDAVIQNIVLDKEKPDEFIIEFKGQGKASQYTNDNGDICLMQDPFLVTSTGELSMFKIPVTWRDKPEE